MTRVRRAQTTKLTVSRATIRRRARTAERTAAEHAAQTALAKRRAELPETLGQARVWTRKNNRYLIAGLCPRCAAQAAYGHAEGFANIKDPCSACQPLVDHFPGAGPRGSKWRKILDKLEYMSEEELGAWFDARQD